MVHYLNVCDVSGSDVEPVDIITFGSPCQDLSIAGKQKGLSGNRSGLFMEAVRIIREMRESTGGEYPKYALWENVPGAFSSNKGGDFRTVLEELCRVCDETVSIPRPTKQKWRTAGTVVGDGWSIAWRVLDAKYHGVPQRRRRIFLVTDFTGECAAEVLFKQESLPGNSEEGFCSRERIAGSITKSAGETGDSITCLNDQGGRVMSVSKDITATLRAEEHGHQPCVMQSSGFCTEHSAKSRSVGYEEERSPTLRAGVVPGAVMSFEPGAASRVGGHTDENLSGSLRANMGDNQTAVVIENHPTDSRVKLSEDNKVQTLTSRMGTGGGNVPLVMNTPKTLKIRSGCEGGGKGALIQDDKSATLGCNNDQTVFVPTAFGICSDKSNSMQSSNPHSGIYKADTSRTIDTNGGNPGCNQGGIAVVALQDSMNGIDRAAFNQGKNALYKPAIDEEQQPTLTAKGPGAVAHPASFYPQMKAESQCYRQDGTSNTIINGTNPGYQNGLVEPDYIVRRLTPTECARLQGFPDYWCSDLGIENPTEDDITFWTEVWETHRKINGVSKKPKSRKQIIKWLQNPHSDTAEYKMWGNGVALPCVLVPISKMAKRGCKTLGSLFDGSGGFPLAGVICGIKPLWCSEIEPYPIAVTKSRFG